MAGRVEFAKENYIKKFIGSLYTERPQNTKVYLQSEPYQFILKESDKVKSEKNGQLEGADFSVSILESEEPDALFTESPDLDVSYKSSSVLLYYSKYYDPFEKGFSEANSTYTIPIDRLIISDFAVIFPKGDAMAQARLKISSLSSQDVIVKALEILERLEQFLRNSSIKTPMPRLHSFTLEDGSGLIELAGDHLRLGFNIEHDLNESSWYLVTDDSKGNIRASGDIRNADIESPLSWCKIVLE